MTLEDGEVSEPLEEGEVSDAKAAHEEDEEEEDDVMMVGASSRRSPIRPDPPTERRPSPPPTAPPNHPRPPSTSPRTADPAHAAPSIAVTRSSSPVPPKAPIPPKPPASIAAAARQSDAPQRFVPNDKWHPGDSGGKESQLQVPPQPVEDRGEGPSVAPKGLSIKGRAKSALFNTPSPGPSTTPLPRSINSPPPSHAQAPESPSRKRQASAQKKDPLEGVDAKTRDAYEALLPQAKRAANPDFPMARTLMDSIQRKASPPRIRTPPRQPTPDLFPPQAQGRHGLDVDSFGRERREGQEREADEEEIRRPRRQGSPLREDRASGPHHHHQSRGDDHPREDDYSRGASHPPQKLHGSYERGYYDRRDDRDAYDSAEEERHHRSRRRTGGYDDDSYHRSDRRDRPHHHRPRSRSRERDHRREKPRDRHERDRPPAQDPEPRRRGIDTWRPDSDEARASRRSDPRDSQRRDRHGGHGGADYTRPSTKEARPEPRSRGHSRTPSGEPPPSAGEHIPPGRGRSPPRDAAPLGNGRELQQSAKFVPITLPTSLPKRPQVAAPGAAMFTDSRSTSTSPYPPPQPPVPPVPPQSLKRKATDADLREEMRESPRVNGTGDSRRTGTQWSRYGGANHQSSYESPRLGMRPVDQQREEGETMEWEAAPTPPSGPPAPTSSIVDFALLECERRSMSPEPTEDQQGRPTLEPIPAQAKPSWATAGVSHIDEYQLMAKLGEGTFGEVCKGIYWGPEYARQTGKSQKIRVTEDKPRPGMRVKGGDIVALKRILTHNESDGMPITSLREIRLLKSLDHVNVVPVVDMAYATGDQAAYQRAYTYMVFPYLAHDLAGLLENKSISLTEAMAKLFSQQLLRGTAYLHTNNILHRDMKAANLLISNDGTLKIADFGLARSMAPADSGREYTGMVVTRWYRPPEILLGNRRYHLAVDMWGIGCVIAEMFHKKPIFAGTSDINQCEQIFDMCGNPSEESMPGWQRLPGCEGLNQWPPRRRRVAERWMRYGKELADLLDRLLVLDPTRRLTAAAALDHEWFWTDPIPARHAALSWSDSHEYDRRKHDDLAQRSQEQQLVAFATVAPPKPEPSTSAPARVPPPPQPRAILGRLPPQAPPMGVHPAMMHGGPMAMAMQQGGPPVYQAPNGMAMANGAQGYPPQAGNQPWTDQAWPGQQHAPPFPHGNMEHGRSSQGFDYRQSNGPPPRDPRQNPMRAGAKSALPLGPRAPVGMPGAGPPRPPGGGHRDDRPPPAGPKGYEPTSRSSNQHDRSGPVPPPGRGPVPPSNQRRGPVVAPGRQPQRYADDDSRRDDPQLNYN